MNKLIITSLIVVGISLAAIGDEPKAPDKKPVEKQKIQSPIENLKPEQLPSYLQDVSVTIHADGSQGSGVIKIKDGVTYVLTCGHVVESLRHERKSVNPKTGSRVEFDDAKVVKEIYEDGRSVGYVALDAEVVRYSDAENGEDLALLRVRKKNLFKNTVVFSNETKPVPVGNKLFHVGSLLGQIGSNSLTTGIVSQHGRVRSNTVFDQSTASSFHGSSGGGLFNEKGEYIGMVVRGAGETFNLYVPMRRILEWADRVEIGFILDEKADTPDEDIMKKSVEELIKVDDKPKVIVIKKSVQEFDKEFPLLPVKK